MVDERCVQRLAAESIVALNGDGKRRTVPAIVHDQHCVCCGCCARRQAVRNEEYEGVAMSRQAPVSVSGSYCGCYVPTLAVAVGR